MSKGDKLAVLMDYGDWLTKQTWIAFERVKKGNKKAWKRVDMLQAANLRLSRQIATLLTSTKG